MYLKNILQLLIINIKKTNYLAIIKNGKSLFYLVQMEKFIKSENN